MAKSEQEIYCVTGHMAAGKNAASLILEKKGFACVDFDVLVHQAIEDSRNKILQAFSEIAKQKNIVLTKSDGTLDRRALGSLLFKNKELLEKQESIVYPAVINAAKDFATSHKNQNVVFNATVLYKTPELMNMCKKIIFITAPVKIRMERAKLRDNLSQIQIKARFKSQKNLLSEYQKFKIPMNIINNTTSIEQLEKKLELFTNKD